MLRSRFFWRLYAGYVAIVVVTAVVLGAITARRTIVQARATIASTLDTQTLFLADALFRGLDAALQARIDTLGTRLGTRLTVIDASGVVLADSDENPALMDNHRHRPEVLAANAQGRGVASRLSNTLGVQMMYVARPVHRDQAVVGYVRAAMPLTDIDDRIRGLLLRVAAAVLFAAGLALLLAIVIGRRLSTPLHVLTTTAESFAEGALDRRVKLEDFGEFGSLAGAFNTMADELQARIDSTANERNRLRAILGGLSEGVVAVDADERVVHVNQLAAELIGVTPEQAIGRRIWEVTRVRDVSDVLASALERSTHVTTEVRFVGHPHDRFVELGAAPYRGAEHEPGGAVAVLRDVTELRRLEAIRRDFVANVSHELKTPITVILGVVETLLDDPAMDADTAASFLGKMQKQSQLLSMLVTDLLQLARLEASDSRLRKEILDLRVIADEVDQLLATRPEAANLDVALEIADDVMMVEGDREALRQMVTNLVDNALKYTSTGGRVVVRFRNAGSHATVEVEDTGPGIEAQHRERIFERFYRVDAARSREQGGTGLGLAIVKHVALSHGGTVTVDSSPGRGSVFRVSVPLREGA